MKRTLLCPTVPAPPRLSLPALKSLTSHSCASFLFIVFLFFIFSEKKKKKLKEKKKNEENSALSNCACSPKIEFACPEVTDFSFLCISLFFLFFLEKNKKTKRKNGENSASVQLCLP